MTEQKDLSLNLSLCFTQKYDDCSLQLNLMPSSSSFTTNSLCQSPWDKTLHSSDQIPNKTKDVETSKQPFLYDLDVNQSPSSGRDCEEYNLLSSPNSTLSSISGSKRKDREDINNGSSEELDADRACSHGVSDEEDGDPSRKKLRLSKDQSVILEESFKQHNTLNPKHKTTLAKKLGLRPRQIEVWFQNRRARTKLKQTEVDCEFLKKCCENLTEENRRLLREVQELRALKHSPQFYMQMTPPTTLTICPSCDGVAGDRVAGSPMPTTPIQVTGRQIGHKVGTIQTRTIGINPWATNSLINHRSFNVHPHS